MTQISHFLLTNDGAIEQIPTDKAAAVASGEGALPEFAQAKLRYLQVVVDENKVEENVQVRTAGALLDFDDQGRIADAGVALGVDDGITSFEHDTCVQLALDGVVESDIIHH